MTKIHSPEELPQMILELQHDGFYGELQLTFRTGALTRLVLQESQVFNSKNNGRTPNEQYRPKQQ